MKAVLIILALVGVAVGPAIYGLILAFKASIILGIMILVIQPSPTILGWLAIFGNPEVCSKLAAWMSLPF